MTKHSFRTSQGIAPFGIGAIVDFVDDTLMMAGLDAWEVARDENSKLREATKVVDERLAARLSFELKTKIRHFYSPALAPENKYTMDENDRGTMPFVRFPLWHYCTSCRRMKELKYNTRSDSDERLLCNNARPTHKGGKSCRELGIKGTLIPTRFVVACSKGHIFDFPWVQWVHEGFPCDKIAPDSEEKPELYFRATSLSGTSGLKIECKSCGKDRKLTGAFNSVKLEEVLHGRCANKSPWLPPSIAAESCNGNIQTIQRSGSNAYFAQIAKSIVIPNVSPEIARFIDSVRWLLQRFENRDEARETLSNNPDIPPGVSIDKILDHYYNEASSQTKSKIESEADYRKTEYDFFTAEGNGHSNDPRSLTCRKPEMRAYGEWIRSHFDKVTIVNRLTETRALVGFTRLEPPSSFDTCAPLSNAKFDWLPGVQVSGEGIFLQFSAQKLAEWRKRKSVNDRHEKLVLAVSGQQTGNLLMDINSGPHTVLLHTFAHLLIRQLSFASGYDSSSISERIYASREMAGVLLYTASGDSEGSLGGLVRQADADYLPKLIQSALSVSQFCSSDPLCMESEGQGLNSLNLAACHSCSLLPETSCEQSNMLLDRGFVIGSPDQHDLGYFSDF